MRVRHKPWAKDYLLSLPFHVDLDSFIFEKVFNDSYTKIAVEIGVGKGDYLKAMAEKYPDVFFFGIELNASVLAVAAQKLEEVKLPNVYICNADALLMLPKFLEKSVDYVILNHSDPWPKKRHEKRRLTHPKFLKEYIRILKKDALLLLKTDNDELAQYSLEMFRNEPFKTVEFNDNYLGDSDFDARTEYETKFSLKGVKIKRIIGRK